MRGSPNSQAAARSGRGTLKPRDNLGRVVGINAVLAMLIRGVDIAFLMVATPWMLSTLGHDRFGVLTLAMSFIAYGGFLDFGLAQAVVAFLPRFEGPLVRRQKKDFMDSALCLSTLLAALVFAGLVLGSGPLSRLFQIAPTDRPEAALLFRWMAPCLALQFPMGLFQAVLLHYHRNHVVTLSGGLGNLARYAAFFLLVSAGVPLWSLGASQALFILVQVLYAGKLAFQNLGIQPGLSLNRAPLDLLLPFGGKSFVSTLASGVIVHIDRILLAILRPVEQLPYYSISMGMASKLWEIPKALMVPTTPVFAQCHAAGQKSRLLSAYERVSRISALGTLPLCGILVFFAPRILGLWVGPEFALQAALPLRLVAAGMALSVIITPSATLANAAGFPGIGAKVHVWMAAFHAALLFLLIPRFGPVGAGLAWLAAHVLDLGLMMPAVHRALGLPSLWITLRRVLLGPLLLSALVLPLMTLADASMWSLAPFALFLASGYGLQLFLGWFFVLEDRDRAQVGDLGRRFGKILGHRGL